MFAMLSPSCIRIPIHSFNFTCYPKENTFSTLLDMLDPGGLECQLWRSAAGVAGVRSGSGADIEVEK